jgi:hypothetical protein
MMKKLILFTALSALLLSVAGCAFMRPAQDVARRSHIGMSFAEFKKLTGGNFNVEEMTPKYAIYRLEEWSGPTDNRYMSGAQYFHFDANGRLFKIDSRNFPPPPMRRNGHRR